MGEIRRKGFVLGWAVVLALGVSVLGFAVPTSGQASDSAGHGEDRLSVKYVTNDLVVDLCKWEPMSCPRCLTEPWYCSGESECWFEPWYCVVLDTVYVKKDGSGSGTVTSSPAGINCGAYCSGEFPEGSVVTLTAKAGEGSKFTGWSGDGCAGTGACKIPLIVVYPAVYPPLPRYPISVSVTATFSLESPSLGLTVSKTGTGSGTVTSSPAGIDCGATCTDEFEEGEEVTLTASPEPGSEFGGWTGCESEVAGKCLVTVGADTTVKATFNEVNTLSVQKEGAGMGSVKSAPGGINCMTICDSAKLKFADGPVKEATLTAAPYKGSTFVEWGGDCSGKAATCGLTLSASKSVTAEFAPVPKVGLTLNKVSGAGTVKSSPVTINCAAACSTQTSGFYEGSEVTLTATPYKSAFVQWTGACSGSSPSPDGRR
jgi:hypothetical protein